MQLRFQPLVKQCSSSPTLTLYLASVPLQHFYLFILFSTCIHSITFTAHNAMFWKIKRIGYLGPFLQRSLLFCPNAFVFPAGRAVICARLHRNLCKQLWTARAPTVLGMCEDMSMEVMSLCMWESQCDPLADSCVPLHLEGLKWRVMNDSAEPEIFHAWAPALCELIAAESHISSWLKGCQRGHHMLFLTSFWWPRSFSWILLLNSSHYNEIDTVQPVFCATAISRKVKRKCTGCLFRLWCCPTAVPWDLLFY